MLLFSLFWQINERDGLLVDDPALSLFLDVLQIMSDMDGDQKSDRVDSPIAFYKKKKKIVRSQFPPPFFLEKR